MVPSYFILSVAKLLAFAILYLYNLDRLRFDRLVKSPGSVKRLSGLLVILLIILGLFLITTPVRSRLDILFDSECMSVVAIGVK